MEQTLIAQATDLILIDSSLINSYMWLTTNILLFTKKMLNTEKKTR